MCSQLHWFEVLVGNIQMVFWTFDILSRDWCGPDVQLRNFRDYFSCLAAAKIAVQSELDEGNSNVSYRISRVWMGYENQWFTSFPIRG